MVFFHLLVDCMMKTLLLQVWKEKTVFTVNSSEHYVSGNSFQNSNKSPTKCNNFSVFYPDIYLQLNMFRAFSRPSSGAQ
jgi:hypothetical protein